MFERVALGLLGGLLALFANVALGATLVGEVVSVADGDTLTILDAQKTQHKIRLAGIDAPEKRQAFGEKSKDNLAALTFRKQVSVEWEKYDRYQRIIGKVVVAGRDINLMQVKAGFAWHYKAYEKEQSEGDRMLYATAELKAREGRAGLWADAAPVPPWDFRKVRRER